jgi:haloalkane dehalogenase
VGRLFEKFVPGTAGLDHPTISGAGHFLQEDAGEQLADAIVDFMQQT